MPTISGSLGFRGRSRVPLALRVGRVPRVPLVGVAATLAAVALALAGCGYTGSHSEQVREWVSQNTYVANEQQVVADAHSVELAVAQGTPLQLRTVCGGLSSDAGTLYSSLVTPDHTLTDELAASMEDFFHAAETCAVASSTTSAKTRQALAETLEGLAELKVANHYLATLGVRSSSLYQG